MAYVFNDDKTKNKFVVISKTITGGSDSETTVNMPKSYLLENYGIENIMDYIVISAYWTQDVDTFGLMKWFNYGPGSATKAYPKVNMSEDNGDMDINMHTGSINEDITYVVVLMKIS